ncbi:MAG: hypothetical protein D6737_20400 [Chloroflexi bacterium]|nr:MAG: hypothetical protein D6737_20400 [Chloroflexota bacterium]
MSSTAPESEQSTTTEDNVTEPKDNDNDSWDVRRVVTLATGIFVGIITLIFGIGIVLALTKGVETAALIMQLFRDIVIILITLTFIVILVELSVLIIQIARLATLMKHEAQPILKNTQEAVKHAKGTTEFVGENVTRPIIQTAGFLAGVRVIIRDVGGIRRAIRRTKNDEGGDSR